MIVFRIAQEAYKDDLSGDGASIYGARWNSIGTRMLYSSSYISLAMLESLVHLAKKNYPPGYHLIKIEIPPALENSLVKLEKIKPTWRDEVDYSQWIGDQFIKNNETLLMSVPSVVVPEENNFLINPLYKDFKKVKIVSIEKLELDKRLKLL